MSIKNIAHLYASLPLQKVMTAYYPNETTTSWDAEKIFGCVCDSSWPVGFGAGETQEAEWFGPDCSLRHCPSGVDPSVTTTTNNVTSCAGRAQWLEIGVRNGVNGTAGNLCQVDCAGRGTCNYATGTCTCFNGYAGPNCAITNHYYVAKTPDPVVTDTPLFAHLPVTTK